MSFSVNSFSVSSRSTSNSIFLNRWPWIPTRLRCSSHDSQVRSTALVGRAAVFLELRLEVEAEHIAESERRVLLPRHTGAPPVSGASGRPVHPAPASSLLATSSFSWPSAAVPAHPACRLGRSDRRRLRRRRRLAGLGPRVRAEERRPAPGGRRPACASPCHSIDRTGRRRSGLGRCRAHGRETVRRRSATAVGSSTTIATSRRKSGSWPPAPGCRRPAARRRSA